MFINFNFCHYCIRKQNQVKTYMQTTKSLAVFLQAVGGYLLQITSDPPFQTTVCSQFLLRHVGAGVVISPWPLSPAWTESHVVHSHPWHEWSEARTKKAMGSSHVGILPKRNLTGVKCCATVFSFVNQDLQAFPISKGCGMIKGLTQIFCSNNIICSISMEHSLGA